MVSELASFPPHIMGMLIPIVGAVVGLLIAVTAIVARNWRLVRQAELEASLKSQMIEQGMSPAEIERVLQTHGQ